MPPAYCFPLCRQKMNVSQVYIARCPDYNQRNVDAALHESLQALESASSLIQAGQRVILKVNLLQGRPPEAAVTTHPALVAAVARWVRQAGATPVIADSPGGPFNAGALRHIYEVTGMRAAAEASGAELNYDVSTVDVACPEGRATHKLEAMRVIAEADAIIALPKLKTHSLTRLTGATKILFGTVPGIVKGTYHARFPSVENFSAMLIDLLCHYKPVLTVMDAIVGMEGNGPSGGEARVIGLLLTSTDAIALDVVAATIVSIDPLSVPPIAAAMRRGLTTGRVQDVQVIGTNLDAVAVRGFKFPTTGIHTRMFPDWTPNWIIQQLLASPQAGSKCVGCSVCADNCPPRAITIVGGRARINLQRCIHCYCCHELCPENAMELHRPWLARLISQ